MSNISNILFTLLFEYSKIKVVLAMITTAICLVLYFLCDSEKERGWLLVGATIVVFGLFMLSRVTEADLLTIKAFFNLQ